MNAIKLKNQRMSERIRNVLKFTNQNFPFLNFNYINIVSKKKSHMGFQGIKKNNKISEEHLTEQNSQRNMENIFRITTKSSHDAPKNTLNIFEFSFNDLNKYIPKKLERNKSNIKKCDTNNTFYKNFPKDRFYRNYSKLDMPQKLLKVLHATTKGKIIRISFID